MPLFHRAARLAEDEGRDGEGAKLRGGLLAVVDVFPHDAQILALAVDLLENRHDHAPGAQGSTRTAVSDSMTSNWRSLLVTSLMLHAMCGPLRAPIL